MEKRINSYEDLEVYQRLLKLHLEVNEISMEFPKFEMYELGSQLRRSSNSCPANLAEGWNNKHINVYLEGLNRAQGELNETRHHLTVAYKKNYLTEEKFKYFENQYTECGKMVTGLRRSLENLKLSRTT